MKIRPDIRETIDRYIAVGWPLGDFLTAVMRNDLMESFARADEYNRQSLFEICQYVYDKVPMAARGENVKLWMEKGGMQGQIDTGEVRFAEGMWWIRGKSFGTKVEADEYYNKEKS